ncbi:helix-turn-helix domain-containing protein [Streptomyces ficellus]|uniref:Helix-turn-helix domain-containing protein n=1 Tax=Streptomyces ficellus TaxID=1977088 RepID=A0ABT7Z4Z0_9ACTN|nr:helix-turn-helix domain-containing protein [Streptomyces ficellus]MDN3294546.1 helix-turn-helix domain-containing protein [Streptomyces ficellus]
MIQGELTTLGLGRTEERAYEALLREQADGADDLARLLDLPRERLDAALDRLVEHGFARPPDPAHEGCLPHPAAPAAALRTLIHRRQAELHLKSAELARLRMAADRLVGDFGEPRASGAGVEVVTGRRAIAARVEGLLAAAEREVVILDRPPFTSPDVGALLARGVKVRAVLDRAGLADPARTRALACLAGRGLRVRVAGDVPAKLLAVDRRITLLPPTEAAGPRASALVVGDGLLCGALVPLFEAVWERATPLGGGDGGLRGPQRELLALLAAGLKDEAIARRLGVHVHTARRRISRLLESLDARTRFQAGARASSRGWLDS